jgi:hypothetical protein
MAAGMPQQLLRAAREEAERSEPPVKAAAFLRIARVLVRFDAPAAELVLQTGIALVEELSGETRSVLIEEAAYLAATVSPKHALSLYSSIRNQHKGGGKPVVRLVNNMATHGHVADAIAYLNDPLPGDRFPLYMVNNYARECRDDATRLDLLRCAIRAWRVPIRVDFGLGEFGQEAFAGFFARNWNLLPREEAGTTIHEIVKWILRVADSPAWRKRITGDPNDPEFTSKYQYLLFQILPALRRLDPDLTNSLSERNPQFAIAAARFPFGMESVPDETPQGAVCEDYIMIGKPNQRFIRITEALANDFEEAFREAFHRYANDSDSQAPNSAPKECWPSNQEFRNILFKAGQHQGQAAAKYLDRIPDPDLRLLAQIELCAALAGLPPISHRTIYHKAKER